MFETIFIRVKKQDQYPWIGQFTRSVDAGKEFFNSVIVCSAPILQDYFRIASFRDW
jgi:hypothetical protein